MIAFDTSAVLLGLLVGVGMSVGFFAGLNWGVRYALRSDTPVRLLLVSALVRIAALLAVGWWVVGQGGPWALLGYAAAFLAVRLLATTLARAKPEKAAAP